MTVDEVDRDIFGCSFSKTIVDFVDIYEITGLFFFHLKLLSVIDKNIIFMKILCSTKNHDHVLSFYYYKQGLRRSRRVAAGHISITSINPSE